ncbi:MAG TPA: DUF4912 domain-containing protein [Thermoguttaceae bacterium]|nr:DUF4912 domain-containing protein [Thermoguttaceae bacterium]
MAKKKKITGWHEMRKDELIRALVNQARAAAARAARRAQANGRVNGKNGNLNGKNGRVNGSVNGKKKTSKQKTTAKKKAVSKSATTKSRRVDKPATKIAKKVRTPHMERRLKQAKAKLAEAKDLSFHCVAENNGHTKDRLVVLVRDPYWLHVHWQLARASVQRVRAAMGQHWHGAKPVLRLYEVTRNGTTSTARRSVRDIEIHGGVVNWYVDVQNPPHSYQIDIGYLTVDNNFFSLATSNVVTTPRAGNGDSFDQNWSEVAKDSDRIFAMSGGFNDSESTDDLKEVLESQVHRTLGEPVVSRFGSGASANGHRDFDFKVDTELIVHGTANPGTHVTLRGEPIRLRSDGTFAVRFTLPDRRHVLPVVAQSQDGVEQRTIVLAVDRNTKVLDPIIREPGG